MFGTVVRVSVVALYLCFYEELLNMNFLHLIQHQKLDQSSNVPSCTDVNSWLMTSKEL